MLVTILSNLFFGYQTYLKLAYVTAWGRTTTPPVQRLGLLGESVAIASFIKPVARTKKIEKYGLLLLGRGGKVYDYSLNVPCQKCLKYRKFLSNSYYTRKWEGKEEVNKENFQITKIILIWPKPQNHKIS